MKGFENAPKRKKNATGFLERGFLTILLFVDLTFTVYKCAQRVVVHSYYLQITNTSMHVGGGGKFAIFNLEKLGPPAPHHLFPIPGPGPQKQCMGFLPKSKKA